MNHRFIYNVTIRRVSVWERLNFIEHAFVSVELRNAAHNLRQSEKQNEIRLNNSDLTRASALSSRFYSNFCSTVPVAVEEVDVSVTVVSVEGVEDWSELSDVADDGVSCDVCWDDVGVDPD